MTNNSSVDDAVDKIIALVQKGEDELDRGVTDLAFDAFIDIGKIAKTIGGECHGCQIWQATAGDEAARGNEYEVEVRDLKAKNAQLIEALSNVRALIAEGAAFGFNHTLGGDWADRLFHSQQMTSTALKANGVPNPRRKDFDDVG